jgi:hypothetical protein
MGPRDLRNQRFAHFNLQVSIPHPFAAKILLDAFPVLPARFWESKRGIKLRELYDNIARFNYWDLEQIRNAIEQVVLFVLPVLIIAHEWNLPDSEMLAKGLGLIPKKAGDGLCDKPNADETNPEIIH